MRFLMTTDTVGGVWAFTCELAGDLLRRKHAVALVSFGPPPSSDQNEWIDRQSSRFGDDFVFRAGSAPLEWAQKNETALTAGEPTLAAVAEAFRPDLLLSNQFCFGAVRLQLPRVVVAHSDVLSWAAAAKPSAQEPSPWLNRYTALVQRGLLQADAVVAPTSAMLGMLKANFFLPCDGTVIANGRRIAFPDRLQNADQARKLQAVTAGRLWDEAKGLDLLTSADLPFPVLIAGETSFGGEHAPTLPETVECMGPLAPDRLYALFSQSSVYLCTSLYEPFGLAPLEAALCGCAVVARDLPSLREVWADSALYFTDAPSLASSLRLLADDPHLLAQLQERSATRAAQFTPERMVDSYLQLFQTVLQKPQSLSPVTPLLHVA